MLKDTINYVDYDGVSTTEELAFHLTKLEITELAMDLPDELAEKLGDNADPAVLLAIVTESLGKKGIIEFIKKFVLKAYGKIVATQDGKFRFKKSEALTEEFEDSLAFQEFVMKLMTDDEASTKFFTCIIPEELKTQIPNVTPATIAAQN